MANHGGVASPFLTLLLLSPALCTPVALATPRFGSPLESSGDPTPDDPAARASRPIARPYDQEAEIPKKPSAPPLVAPRVPTDPFRCQRNFSYQGKVYGCDSNIRLDGERLRDILQDTPAAISELNLYQSNRFKIRNAAYYASAGLLVTALGILAHDCPDTSVAKSVTTIGGIGILLGSVAYAFGFIRNNENHLTTAVQLFNDAHPGQPVQLQFTTDLNLK